MIRVSELRLELDEDESLLRKKAGKVLRTDPKYIEKLTIFAGQFLFLYKAVINIIICFFFLTVI